MKIAVCIKQVPTREWQPRLNDDKTWVRDQDVSYEMNEPDAYALEEALRLREKHGGEVVVCSAGPARVQQVIREALARGADRALHVEDDALAAADAFTAAAALTAAMAEQKFDLILTGLQSDDQGHAQFGPGARREIIDSAFDDHHGSERRPSTSAGQAAARCA
jgi:electron transfer flavoprotein beta subunit